MAAEIKIRAERRAGELLAAIERKQGPGPGRKTRQHDEKVGYLKTIESAGIPEPTARRWQEDRFNFAPA